MKRFLLIFLVGFFLCLTGCTKADVMICEKVSDVADYAEVDEVVTAYFKNDKLSDIKLNVVYTFLSKDLAEDNKEVIDLYALSYKMYGFSESSATLDGKVITLNAKGNLDEVKKTVGDSLTALKYNSDTNMDIFRVTYITDGYVCEIK